MQSNLIYGENLMNEKYKNKIISRFWNRVEITPDNQCWKWKSYKQTGGGYGIIASNFKFFEYAHRVSWEIHYGPIPKGMLICHHCDNPECANPKHLFLGTSKDNVQDMIQKGRKNPAHSHPNRKSTGEGYKLSKSDIDYSINAYDHINITMKDLAKKFNVTPSAIYYWMKKNNKTIKNAKIK